MERERANLSEPSEPIGDAIPVLPADLGSTAGGLSWHFCSASPKGF